MAASASPAFQVTGAVHHYVASGLHGTSPTPLYLGTAESTPQVRFQEMGKPVMNDVTGPLLPAQKVDGGEMATIAVALNYFSYSTFSTMRLWSANTGAAHMGRRNRFSRGLTRYGRATFRLWQVFENALDSGIRATYPNLPLGRYWPQVELITKEVPREGTQDQLIVVTFEAQPYFVPQASPTTVASGEREFFLFSELDADFPNSPNGGVLVPQ